MIEELGKVVSIDGRDITVTSEIKSACGNCKQVDSCGSGQVAKAFPKKQMTINLISKLPVKVGDTVVIGISEQCVIHSAWQVYLFPIIGLLSFSGFGQWLVQQNIFSHEVFGILFGVIGGYLGYRIAFTLQNSEEQTIKLAPKILRIISEKTSVTQIEGTKTTKDSSDALN